MAAVTSKASMYERYFHPISEDDFGDLEDKNLLMKIAYLSDQISTAIKLAAESYAKLSDRKISCDISDIEAQIHAINIFVSYSFFYSSKAGIAAYKINELEIEKNKQSSVAKKRLYDRKIADLISWKTKYLENAFENIRKVTPYHMTIQRIAETLAVEDKKRIQRLLEETQELINIANYACFAAQDHILNLEKSKEEISFAQMSKEVVSFEGLIDEDSKFKDTQRLGLHSVILSGKKIINECFFSCLTNVSFALFVNELLFYKEFIAFNDIFSERIAAITSLKDKITKSFYDLVNDLYKNVQSTYIFVIKAENQIRSFHHEESKMSEERKVSIRTFPTAAASDAENTYKVAKLAQKIASFHIKSTEESKR